MRHLAGCRSSQAHTRLPVEALRRRITGSRRDVSRSWRAPLASRLNVLVARTRLFLLPCPNYDGLSYDPLVLPLPVGAGSAYIIHAAVEGLLIALRIIAIYAAYTKARDGQSRARAGDCERGRLQDGCFSGRTGGPGARIRAPPAVPCRSNPNTATSPTGKIGLNCMQA